MTKEICNLIRRKYKAYEKICWGDNFDTLNNECDDSHKRFLGFMKNWKVVNLEVRVFEWFTEDTSRIQGTGEKITEGFE